MVSPRQAAGDHAQAVRLQADLRRRISQRGVDVKLLRLKDEPNDGAEYARRGDSIVPNNSISFRNLTNEEGKIVRRLVILYPMSQYRRAELPAVQLLEKLKMAKQSRQIELLDLRQYEENHALVGTMAPDLSFDGRFMCMSRSACTDDALLDLVSSKGYLGIPLENRFVFPSAVPPRGWWGGHHLPHECARVGR